MAATEGGGACWKGELCLDNFPATVRMAARRSGRRMMSHCCCRGSSGQSVGDGSCDEEVDQSKKKNDNHWQRYYERLHPPHPPPPHWQLYKTPATAAAKTRESVPKSLVSVRIKVERWRSSRLRMESMVRMNLWYGRIRDYCLG
jgi:hypothetical protein